MMALSIQRLKSKWAYMIKPDDPCQIWVRLNRKNVRWNKWGDFDTPEQAQRAIFMLERPDTAVVVKP